LLSVRQSARVSLQSRVQAGVFGIVEIFLIEALGAEHHQWQLAPFQVVHAAFEVDAGARQR
jgi:hypothetical protein